MTHGRRALAGAVLGGALLGGAFGGAVALAAPASAVTLDAKITLPSVKVPAKVRVPSPDVSTPSTPAVPTIKPTVTPTVPDTRPDVPSVDRPPVPVRTEPGAEVDVDVDVDPTTGDGVTIDGPDPGRPAAPDAEGVTVSTRPTAGSAPVAASAGAVRDHRHGQRVVALESGVTGDDEGVTGAASTGGEAGTISDQLVSAARGIGPTNGGVLVAIGLAWAAWTFMQRRRRLARERRRAEENTGFLAGVDSDLTGASGLVEREPAAVR
ncbi:hypothetical protein ACIB24_09125 [Spongisporangium articulatum]|uniref:Uncharacterized protein n=1 Tax=Spongisporangium articulatum TaxID=3362603 RepID=A0ABW8ALI9_9ACTN